MWAGAGATRAIGFSARRENRIEIEIASRRKFSRHSTRQCGNFADENILMKSSCTVLAVTVLKYDIT